jgi:16S rRNA (guanine527-N7)-methyltransferase
VTGSDAFQAHLSRLAEEAHISLQEHDLDSLWRYYALLERWNRAVNLTALPLAGCPEATLRRLIVEPLKAARFVPNRPLDWFDLGSGGGSPAIPLKVVHRRPVLRMVEARSRKAAFLREVVRTLELPDAIVLNSRIEHLPASGCTEGADLLTLRAVRVDRRLLETARALLRPGGRLVVFGGASADTAGAMGFEVGDSSEGVVELRKRLEAGG